MINELTTEEKKQHVLAIFKNFTQKDIDKSLAVYPAFSDFSITVSEQIANGNTIISKWVATAVHTGNFAGIEASGKRVTLTGKSVHVVEHNKVTETSIEMDLCGFVDQLSA
jgi:predicted ester cyclase